MSRVQIVQGKKAVSVEGRPGDNMLDFLRQEGFFVNAPCGGNGTCKKCKVKVQVESAGSEGSEELKTVLACQTPVPDQDCRIQIPDYSGPSMEIETGFFSERDRASASVKEGISSESLYGAAVDLGTTTVVAKLCRLSDGKEAGVRSGWNRQARYGADVISRVKYIMENQGGLEELCLCARSQIFSMIREMCREQGIEENKVVRLSLAGNTIMQHIFAGRSPVSIAAAPFKPETFFLENEPEKEEGLSFRLEGEGRWPGLEIFYAPCAAGYVGGDIIAGLGAACQWNGSGKYIYLDVGTNGEMVLGSRNGLICCSVASGPAFEGAEISCGMAGLPGAVSGVKIAEDGKSLVLETVGDEEPKGICGSGLIDLLAVLVKTGEVNQGGRLLPPKDAREGGVPDFIVNLLEEDENGNGRLWLTEDHQVWITADDIRKLQLAKAAVMAGIRVMMRLAGTRDRDIEKLYIAGGFGRHLDPDSAAAIGMIPEKLKSKIVYVGNGSLAGAAEALESREFREEMVSIQKRCHYLELSGNKIFNDEYLKQMAFMEG